MSLNSIGDKEQFWKVIEYLTDLDHVKSINEISSDLSTTPESLLSYLNFLSDVSFNIEIETNTDGERFLRPPESKPQIQVNFSLSEWLGFQAHFPFLSEASELPFHKTIKNKLAVLENTYNAHDLFEPLKTLDEIMNHKTPTIAEVGVVGTHELITYVEESILEKQVMSINIDDKYQSIYPQSLVFLEGELSLIGENINDKTLFNIPLTNITNLTDDDVDWTPSYSRIEVDDFISSIRAISESEVRLVLKINGLANFENSIPRNFLGNPAMVTNGEGDLIWGATIESNHEVFNWIHDLGADVEILDPIDFKKEYLEYCEDQLKKLA